MSVAQRVTHRFRPTAQRERRSVPQVPGSYYLGPGACNAARVTFATGCQAEVIDFLKALLRHIDKPLLIV